MAAGNIDVRHVARLARLALTDDEVARFGAQLVTLLDHVASLEALPVAEVAATAQVIPVRNVMRADVPRPSLDREALLAGAPRTEGAFVRAPRILGEAP